MEFSPAKRPDGGLSCSISSWSEENDNMWQSQQRDEFQILSRALKDGNNTSARKNQYTWCLQQFQAQIDSTLFLHLHFQLCFRVVIDADLRWMDREPFYWAVNVWGSTWPSLQQTSRSKQIEFDYCLRTLERQEQKSLIKVRKNDREVNHLVVWVVQEVWKD